MLIQKHISLAMVHVLDFVLLVLAVASQTVKDAKAVARQHVQPLVEMVVDKGVLVHVSQTVA